MSTQDKDAIKEIIKTAINTRKMLNVEYNSKSSGVVWRIYCPFVLGEAADGDECVIGHQLSGGKGNHFARYNLDSLVSVAVLEHNTPSNLPETYDVNDDKWNSVEAKIYYPFPDSVIEQTRDVARKVAGLKTVLDTESNSRGRLKNIDDRMEVFDPFAKMLYELADTFK
jgi:hypothetical protein